MSYYVYLATMQLKNAILLMVCCGAPLVALLGRPAFWPVAVEARSSVSPLARTEPAPEGIGPLLKRTPLAPRISASRLAVRRDIFQFAEEPTRFQAEPAAVARPTTESPAASACATLRLIGVAARSGPEGVQRTAILSGIASDVTFGAVGEYLAGCLIVSISSDAAIVRDVASQWVETLILH